MTPESLLSVICKLNDTIDAQQAQIEQLQVEIARLTPDTEEAPEWPDTPTNT